MSPQNTPVWSVLSNAGIVTGEQPDTGDPESPWFVKVLLAISGWLAAIFLLVFVGIGFEFVFDNPIAALIVGSLMIAGAYVMLRQPKNEFIEHASLAISIAGQALVIFAIVDFSDRNDELMWVLIALFEAVLAWFMPNFIHRVFSSWVAAGALSMAMMSVRIPYLFGNLILLSVALLWLNEYRYPEHMRTIQGIGYGLVLSVLTLWGFGAVGMSMARFGVTTDSSELLLPYWVGEVLASAITVYVVWCILQRLGDTVSAATRMVAIAGTIVLCLASFEARGITVGLTIILLGFAGSNRVLLGMGVIALLYYVSSYYYFLQVTLLAKAQTLFIVGLVLLAARWILMRMTRKTQEAAHA